MFLASLSWALMVLPMCVVRLAMLQVGFTARQGVFVIEGHFLGMYLPGFVSGKLIHRHGVRAMSVAAALLFLGSIGILQLVNGSAFGTWFVGMLALGVAWNILFTSATVWTSRTAYDVKTQPHLQSPVQAANDFLMFLFVGAWVMSSSYIFESAGGGIGGWRVLTGTVLSGLLALAGGLLLVDSVLDRKERRSKCTQLPLTVK
jgi:hypothetical protein